MADEKQKPQLPQDQQQAFVASEDVNKRIKPAMAIIKELFSRIDQKRQAEAQEKATKDAVELAQQNAEMVMEQPKEIYVSLDGDNIGNAVARAEEKDDEKALADISNRINSGQEVLKQWALSNGGKVIEAGGDEGLVKVPSHAKNQIEQLRQSYQRVVGATATVGMGFKISESTKARMLGKLRGKNRVVMWEPEMQKELDLRVRESGGEASKIKTAGLGGQAEMPEPKQQPEQQPKEMAPVQVKDSDNSIQTIAGSKQEPSLNFTPKGPEEIDLGEEPEAPWDGHFQMVSPEDEDDEEMPSKKFPDWLVNEALDHGMEPHTYARLLRSYGHEI